MAKRKGISKKTRFEVFKRDKFTCQYCGSSAPEVVLELDHIHPVSKGGEDDLLNYSTACVDCNQGKKDRPLSDNSVIRKQKSQLDNLQVRREQLEMMVLWRDGLKSIEDDTVGVAIDAFNEITPGWSVSKSGREKLAKFVKKFGLAAVLKAVDIASEQYVRIDEHGKATADSTDTAFSKLGGICQMNSLPEWKQKIYHIRNIARKRSGEDWFPQTGAEILSLFEEAHREGDSFEQLEDLALRGIGYRELPDVLRDWIKQSKQERKRREIGKREQAREERIAMSFEGLMPDAAYSAAAIDILQATGEMEYPN